MMRGWILMMGLATLGAGAGRAPNDPLRVEPDQAVFRLDEVGLYRVGVAYRGKPEEEFPIGWSGPFEDRTGMALAPDGVRNGRASVLQHCPWRGGTGTAFQEFHVQLPSCRRILLRGAAALRGDATGAGKSDGVAFRIKADGKLLLDVLRTDSAWKPFEFDLTAEAGRLLVLRFETDPGPKDDASFDFGLWADRALVFEGFQPPAVVHPAPPATSVRGLVSRVGKGLAPPATTPVRYEVKRDGDAFLLGSRDDYGGFTFRWSLPRAEAETGVLGAIVLEADRKGAPTAVVPLATSARIGWNAPAEALETRWEDATGGGDPVLVRTFRVGGQVAALRVKGAVAGRSLALDVEIDKSVAAWIDGGGWGPVARRREVPTPYYDGKIDFFPVEDLFVSSGLDWTASAASAHDGMRARYEPLTDETRLKARERVLFSVGWNLDDVLPNIPNAPSPHIKDLSARIVLDVWGGRFADVAKKLETLADYGIERCAVILHDWQRSGYDNALPAHYPAADDKGGEPGLLTLKAVGKRHGHLVALHENYVDYYPNYERFDEKDVAVDSKGKRIKAWFHPGNKIQSFAVKPTAMLRLAESQSPEIHKRYGTDSSFLDVCSSVVPWFHVDQQAGLEGSGTFQSVRQTHRALWSFLRKTHGGPVLGEGNHHWYWSGELDGVEAQFGSGWPSNAGRSAPLLVDFDLLKIHPLQVNHGMGYYERWWDRAERPIGGLPPVVVLDQYRMQEVAFGHAGFLGGNVWSSIPFAWLESNLVGPVMARYGPAIPTQITYERNGRWVDASAVVRSGDAKADAWNRVRVRYDGGLTVTANQSAEPLVVDGVSLPQYGWIAKGGGVTAGTTLRDGIVTDSAETAGSFFANARSAVDWNFSGVKRIRPTVESFRQTGPRRFAATYRWTVHEAPGADYHIFVHFNKPGGSDSEILFQQDHAAGSPTGRWRPGSTMADGPHAIAVPRDLPDGDYAWTIGLHAPAAGRAALEGPVDRTGRNLLGTLHVRDAGGSLTFTPEAGAGPDRLAVSLANLNRENKVVDFGPIRTDGGVAIVRDGADWVAWTFPRDRPFTLILDSTRFGKPREVRSEGGAAGFQTPRFDGRWWRLKPNGARLYRWPAG